MNVHHISETALVKVIHDLLTDSAIRCVFPLINLKDHAFLQTTLWEKGRKSFQCYTDDTSPLRTAELWQYGRWWSPYYSNFQPFTNGWHVLMISQMVPRHKPSGMSREMTSRKIDLAGWMKQRGVFNYKHLVMTYSPGRQESFFLFEIIFICT